MSKRDPIRTTQPMAVRLPGPEDRTDPSGPVDPTDPGPPPSLRADATLPDGRGAPVDEPVDAGDLLAGFKHRAPRPPAPRPKQQANSDGGDFVAYSTVARPAPRAEAGPRERARVEIARLATEADTSLSGFGPMVAQRDIATHVASPRRRGAALRAGVWIGALVLGAAGSFALVAALRSRAPDPPAAVTVTASAGTLAAPVVSAAQPTPSAGPPAPIASAAATRPPPAVSTAASLQVREPTTTSKPAPAAPPNASTTPTRTPAVRAPKPHPPSAGFTWD